jgi:O-antigen ligase
MSPLAPAQPRSPAPLAARLDRAAALCVLGIPPGMLHAFAVAEALIAIILLLFLCRSGLLRDWSWLRRPWVRIALLWWGWAIFCSLPGIGEGGGRSLTQALVVGRYILLVAALEHVVLADPAIRRWLWAVLAACAAWIGLSAVIQATTGRNLAGYPRWGDGELTGPFQKPRAGPPLARLLPVALIPPIGRLLEAGREWWRPAAAALLAAAAVACVVLIGQRMPVLLTVLAMGVAALFLPRLRLPVAAALALGALLVAASAVVAPPTFYRLVTKFTNQMAILPESNYGQVASRAIAIAQDHPLTGRGFEGFRSGCMQERYWRGWTHATNPADTGGGALGCNLHPHNMYLQAVTDAGLPGLALYTAMVLAWGVALARGLWRHPAPLRVALFATYVAAFWPLASSMNAFSIEFGGLTFLLVAFGLAESRASEKRP